MPLVRFEIQNEYSSGAKELYREADKDDPKAILDGLAVAGLVGILRQLGDLAEFAAEVFHDLQERVVATGAKSNNLMVRVKHIEAALPPLEKTVLSQASHIHFAYTAGSDWHANIKTEQNLLAHSDLPRFIMDSYEECRDPPCLHMLDKFDIGGPGACLLRYSDPSYFKRALVSSDAENAEKLQQEKKAHKSKKRRERQKNMRVPLAMSIAENNGRVQFAPPSICRQNSDAETVSTTNMRSRSELGETSFKSTRSDYIECIFYTTSSMPHKEQEHNELPASRLKRQTNATTDSVLYHEQNGVSDSVLPPESLQDQSMVDSSYVTWDEKTEIVKPRSLQSNSIVEDQSNASESMPADYDQNELDSEFNGVVDVDPDEIIHDDENSIESLSDGDLFDEIGSETEHYVDALTEVETDVEHQTKQEEELPPTNNESKKTESNAGTTNKITAQSSASSDFEPCITSYSSSHKPMPQIPFTSLTSEDLVQVQTPDVTGMSPKHDISVGTDFSRSNDLAKFSNTNDCGTAMIDEPSSGINISNSQASSSEKIISSLCDSKESPEISNKPSIKIWTNGGLLGLEPSKPPDYSALNIESQTSASGTKTNEHDLSSDTDTPSSHSNGPQRKLVASVKTSESAENNQSLDGEARSPDPVSSNALPRDQLVRSMANFVRTIDHSQFSTSGHDKQDTCMSKDDSWEFSSNVSNTKFEKSKDSSCSDSFSNSQGRGLTDTNFRVPGVQLPTIRDVDVPSSKPNQDMRQPSSYMSLPSHRLVVNSFGRKKSLAQDNKSEPSGSVDYDFGKSQRAPYIEQKEQNRTAALEPNSLTSSPPLEHMKISFNPTDGFETSKLTLMFSDGHHFHDTAKDDTFSSFHLLPESVVPMEDINSESDDDTFSGSSRYMSDELLSQPSESNSEHWTSSRSPGSEENEIYDALRRVSSEESISSSYDVEGIAHHSTYPGSEFGSPNTKSGTKPPHSGSPINFLNDKDLDLVLRCSDEPTPTPPPLPPMQWCATKPKLDLVEDREEAVSTDLDHQNDLQVPASNRSQQLKPPPQNHLQTKATAALSPTRKEQQKSNGHREADHDPNVKDIDEKEDLLHQIRTKSMSLRRTMPTKPTVKPVPTSNLKVTAILEKANAIRQAFVGSDEDEDSDSWSDS